MQPELSNPFPPYSVFVVLSHIFPHKRNGPIAPRQKDNSS